MELQAVLEALRAIDGRVTVFSDSTYVVNCFRDRWYEGWKKRGWKNTANKPVANRDLWEPLIDLYLRRDASDESRIAFVWVKGHSGNEMNEIADQLAVAAAAAQKPDATSEIVAPWPIEHTVWVVGATRVDDDQSELLTRSVEQMDRRKDVLLSGLRRGAELLGAELALERGIALGVVLPFDDPAVGWPAEDRSRFDRAIEAAEWVVTLSEDRTAPTRAIEARNRWAGRTVVGALVLGDPDLARQLDDQGLSVLSG